LGLAEDALKCQFLEGLAQWEMGRSEAAIVTYCEIAEKAQHLRSPKLEAQALNNLAHFHSSLGDSRKTLQYSQKALPLLKRLKNRVGLAKLQWSIGDLLKHEGNYPAAVEAYRSAQTEAREIGLRGDLAALHLVLADVFLETDQGAQAEWEIRAALPIIEEEQMVPEGMAALSLLRESLRRRQINRQALRELHGYFQEGG
jgi:tetratricopeptide (TPR) repeat protein